MSAAASDTSERIVTLLWLTSTKPRCTANLSRSPPGRSTSTDQGASTPRNGTCPAWKAMSPSSVVRTITISAEPL